MIVIISSEVDYSTNIDCKYLLKEGEKFVRLGMHQFVKSLNIFINNNKTYFELKIGNIVVRSDEIKSYWLRKTVWKY